MSDTKITERLLKNELGQWPHQYMRPVGFGIFGIPMLAGAIDAGIIGALIFGAPLIMIMFIQRFFPI